MSAIRRAHYFGAGPAALPLPVLAQAQEELLDYAGTGISILEHPHRERDYLEVHDETIALVRALLHLPPSFEVMLLQGGASHQFAMLASNFLQPSASADYVITGLWSERAAREAEAIGKVRIAASTAREEGTSKTYDRVPGLDELQLDSDACYVHLTSNNTLFGTQWPAFPITAQPLIADMTSDLLTRTIDPSRFSMMYASAQKNLGAAGVTVVIVHRRLLDKARSDIPPFWRYATHVADRSLFNTPPVFSVYLMRGVLRWIEEQGGVVEMERRSRLKAKTLYDVIDAAPDFYRTWVQRESRSLVNVVFRLPTPQLDDEFIASAAKEHLIGIRGHRWVGGIRVSLYNAVETASVQRLADLMREFARPRR